MAQLGITVKLSRMVLKLLPRDLLRKGVNGNTRPGAILKRVRIGDAT